MSELDLGLVVLDQQLVDCDGRRCGKVDDIELDLDAKGGPKVAALLVGPGAWKSRGVLGRIAARVGGGAVKRIPWSEVKEASAGVHLRRRASELGLGTADDRAARFVARLPGATK